MKTVFLSLSLAVSLSSGVGAFAAGHQAQDKAVKGALHRIVENCRLVKEYAPIYEWDNVNNEVDRIVAAQHRVDKILKDEAQQLQELNAAVKDLRAARLNHEPDRAVAAAEKVNAAAEKLMK